MRPDFAAQPLAWIIVLVVLVASWPIAQSLRHEKLHPLAAYLLFISVLVLVAASVFWLLVWVTFALLGPTALEGIGPAVAVTLVSLVPGFAAGWWIVRRPQWRRMP